MSEREVSITMHPCGPFKSFADGAVIFGRAIDAGGRIVRILFQLREVTDRRIARRIARRMGARFSNSPSGFTFKFRGGPADA